MAAVNSNSSLDTYIIDVDTGYRVLFVIQCLIMVSSISINSLLLSVLIKFKAFAASTALLLKFQCVTDLITSCVGIPMHMLLQTSHVLLPESFTNWLCSHTNLKLALESVSLFPIGYSLFTHTLLAIDRFVSTKWPHDYQKVMSTKRLVCAIAFLIVVTSISLAVVHIELGVNVSRGTIPNFNACELMTSLNYDIVSISLVWNTLIPVSTAFCLYVSILCILKKEMAKVRPQDRNTSHANSMKARNRVTRSTAIILVGCSLCGLPIVFLYYSSHAMNEILGAANATFFLMVGQVATERTSLVNPVVLFCVSSKLRKSAKILKGMVTKFITSVHA